MKIIKLVVAGFLMTVAVSGPATAISFTNEANFQTAVGGIVPLETFDGFAVGNQVSSLPGLGVTFGTLFPGQFPEVENP